MSNDIEEIFQSIKWFNASNSESRSGPGSTQSYTENLRKNLPAIFRAFNVKTFLDAPCGDWNWMQLVDLSDVNYIGLDVVGDIIRKNQATHQRSNVLFGQADITKDALPKADLIMVRDCLFHLKYDLIWDFFRNFANSDIPFLMVTTHLNVPNRDLSANGKFRHLDLRGAPFNFSAPIISVNDSPDQNGTVKRIMGIWSSAQIKSFLKAHQNG